LGMGEGWLVAPGWQGAFHRRRVGEGIGAGLRAASPGVLEVMSGRVAASLESCA